MWGSVWWNGVRMRWVTWMKGAVALTAVCVGTADAATDGPSTPDPCAGRAGCAVIATRDAGTDAEGTRLQVLTTLVEGMKLEGPGAYPEPEDNLCDATRDLNDNSGEGGKEYWLVTTGRDGVPKLDPAPLFQLCNPVVSRIAYGVEVEPNRLTVRQQGELSDRMATPFAHSLTLSLSPRRAMSWTREVGEEDFTPGHWQEEARLAPYAVARAGKDWDKDENRIVYNYLMLPTLDFRRLDLASKPVLGSCATEVTGRDGVGWSRDDAGGTPFRVLVKERQRGDALDELLIQAILLESGGRTDTAIAIRGDGWSIRFDVADGVPTLEHGKVPLPRIDWWDGTDEGGRPVRLFHLSWPTAGSPLVNGIGIVQTETAPEGPRVISTGTKEGGAARILHMAEWSRMPATCGVVEGRIDVTVPLPPERLIRGLFESR